jgi:hypothetical protein
LNWGDMTDLGCKTRKDEHIFWPTVGNEIQAAEIIPRSIYRRPLSPKRTDGTVLRDHVFHGMNIIT